MATKTRKATPPKSTAARRRHNWPKIRAMYVEGIPDDDDGRFWPSLSVLADLLGPKGPDRSRIATHCSDEDWTTQRTIFQAKLARSRQEALAAHMGDVVAEVDARTLAAAAAGIQVIGHRLTEILAATGTGPSRDRKPPSAAELQRLAAALGRLNTVARSAAGEHPEDPDGLLGDAAVLARDETHGRLLESFSTFREEARVEGFLAGYLARDAEPMPAIEATATDTTDRPDPAESGPPLE